MNIGVARVCSRCRAERGDGERACAACGSEHSDRACDACGVILRPSDVTCPSCAPPRDSSESADAAGAGVAAAVPFELELVEHAANGHHNDAANEAIDEIIDEALQLNLADEYHLTRVISRSDRATVYQADDMARHRCVAVKVMAPGRINSEAAATEFLQLAKGIAALKHPHLRGVSGVRQFDSEFMLIMPFVEGRPLSAILAEDGALAIERARTIACQIGSALEYAHGHHVTHRDVRPEHILLDRNGSALLTNLALTADDVPATLNGSAAYLSPEQCDQYNVDWATDQYALGIVLYEMLTGSVPFPASSVEELRSLIQWEPLPIRMLRDDCPVELEQAVLRMLAKHPSNRWPSMAHAVAGLSNGDRKSPRRATPLATPSVTPPPDAELVDIINLFPNVVASWPESKTNTPYIDDPISAIDFVDSATPETADHGIVNAQVPPPKPVPVQRVAAPPAQSPATPAPAPRAVVVHARTAPATPRKTASRPSRTWAAGARNVLLLTAISIVAAVAFALWRDVIR